MRRYSYSDFYSKTSWMWLFNSWTRTTPPCCVSVSDLWPFWITNVLTSPLGYRWKWSSCGPSHLTSGCQNLMSSSSNLCQRFPSAFMRMGHCEVTVILTFDLCPPVSNQFLLESKWKFVPNLEKSLQSWLILLRKQTTRLLLLLFWITGRSTGIPHSLTPPSLPPSFHLTSL